MLWNWRCLLDQYPMIWMQTKIITHNQTAANACHSCNFHFYKIIPTTWTSFSTWFISRFVWLIYFAISVIFFDWKCVIDLRSGNNPSLALAIIIFNPQSSILNPQSSLLNPQSSILNPQPSLLNPQSSILNPQSSILILNSWDFQWSRESVSVVITAATAARDGDQKLNTIPGNPQNWST